MAKGGARVGAGRKPGGQNRKSADIAIKAAQAGTTPLEFMLAIMRNGPPADADALTIVKYQALQFEAARAAAPFVHPRLAAIEHSGEGGGPIKAEVAVRFV